MTTHDLVREIVDTDTWPEVLAEYGPVTVSTTIRRVLKKIGQDEAARNASLALARVDPEVDTDQYRTMTNNLVHWRRSTNRLRSDLNARLAEIRPAAQQIIDSHQSDRRALVVLAKRLWLWEEGLDDQLDEVLDDLTISDDSEGGERITLRQLVDNICTTTEVTP